MALKDHLPSAVRQLGFEILSRIEVFEWKRKGKPMPPPNKIKQQVVKEVSNRSDVKILVETGTYLGNMLFAQKNNFKKLYSIELADIYYQKANDRFSKYSHIEIIRGNSAVKLAELLGEINEPCLFWLDGHYSGGSTAESFCPVMDELKSIFDSSYEHVILIDDARLFTGESDYPSLDEIELFVKSKSKKYDISLENDIIKITYTLASS